jgi:hypothetical protein
MYRRTSKYAAQKRGPRGGRTQRDPVDAPHDLPDLRIRIVIERFDFGAERHEFELRRSRRVDSYRVYVDGQPWRVCGLSRVLEGLRKATPRVLGPRNLA